MKKLPYGISNYEKLIDDGYYYVDKTKYIEKIEKMTNPTIMFLRPRKFGKTLFTTTIKYYYDINEKEKFEKLFGGKYIGNDVIRKVYTDYFTAYISAKEKMRSIL